MRMPVIYTNRAAPGRNAAERFAKFQALRHVFSGGFWKNKQDTYERASRKLEDLMRDDTVREILGMSDYAEFWYLHDCTPSPGLKKDDTNEEERVLKVSSQDGKRPIPYSSTLSAAYQSTSISMCTRWRWMKFSNEKRFGPGDLVGLTAGRVGQLKEILSSESGRVFCLINLFEHWDERFHGCPIIIRTHRHELISAQDLESAVNVQHHCVFAGCGPQHHLRIIQEWQVTEQDHTVCGQLMGQLMLSFLSIASV
ncbi:hypothetical protein DFS34DRAFT_365925 [Phlyctochytrium arcticum]|nr:hypothetical protein DFS34DRAFT_365925 [Phlyctochytrium arcticum]